jgi:hypothetical protein
VDPPEIVPRVIGEPVINALNRLVTIDPAVTLIKA